MLFSIAGGTEKRGVVFAEHHAVVQEPWHSSGAAAADNDQHRVELHPWQDSLAADTTDIGRRALLLFLEASST